MTHWITPDWPAPKHIRAATTLRTGGFSQAEFSRLNPADHVQDNPVDVLKNRQKIKQMLALPSEPLWLRQTHSSDVICADQYDQGLIADASYTRKKNVVCTVLTADCLPLLLCDVQGTVVAAIHAGWRGLLNGIVENTVAKMPDSELLAWLGPAIGPQCFVVGQDVYDLFVNQSRLFSSAFTQQSGDKYLADIYQIARMILEGAGVQKIYGGQFCTVTETERFFSYRRDGQTGRMATLIWMD
ncbi:MAG: peptidoglycan editing factor PgeF [Methyloprofundus sp.]|nr:peptidoglycan editing factor PgeF [Methyloprofundus sp.]MDT8424506.1 peptidoglycan editing factor PgeF [Methyloprofundus sp.]